MLGSLLQIRNSDRLRLEPKSWFRLQSTSVYLTSFMICYFRDDHNQAKKILGGCSKIIAFV